MGLSNLQHIIGFNSVKHNCPNNGFNLRESFELLNGFTKVERILVQRRVKEVTVRFTR